MTTSSIRVKAMEFALPVSQQTGRPFLELVEEFTKYISTGTMPDNEEPIDLYLNIDKEPGYQDAVNAMQNMSENTDNWSDDEDEYVHIGPGCYAHIPSSLVVWEGQEYIKLCGAFVSPPLHGRGESFCILQHNHDTLGNPLHMDNAGYTRDGQPYDFSSCRNIREAIGEAVGAASLCWDTFQTGIFDDGKATNIVTGLLRYINANFDPANKDD